MNKKRKAQTAILLGCLLLWATVFSRGAPAAEAGRLYPANLPPAQWQKFTAAGIFPAGHGNRLPGRAAAGFGSAVGRHCHRLPRPGICRNVWLQLDLQLSVSSGGPLNTPFLGIAVGGRTWVLTTGETKAYDAGNGAVPPQGPGLVLKGVEKAKRIDYWGHFPIADVEYETGAPVSVGLRAWSVSYRETSRLPTRRERYLKYICAMTPQRRRRGRWPSAFPGSPRIKAAWILSGKARTHNMSRFPALAERQFLTYLPPHKIVREMFQGNPSGVWVSGQELEAELRAGSNGWGESASGHGPRRRRKELERH